MNKSEKIQKNALLILLQDVGNEILITSKQVTEVYLYKGTYSIRNEDKRYYCKSEKYYSCEDYAVVLDLNLVDLAMQEAVGQKITRLITTINYYKDGLRISESKLNSIINSEINIMYKIVKC